MAQADLYRLSRDVRVVDLQSDLLGITASPVVAPLREAGTHAALPGLTLEVELDGVSYIVRVQDRAALPAAELRTRVGSLAAARDLLKRALDILRDGV